MRSSTKLLTVQRFATTLAVGWLLLTGGALYAAEAKQARQTDTVAVDNGLLRVAVDRRDGRLLELVDLEAKHNHLGDAEQIGGLWEVELMADGQRNVLKPDMAGAFECEILPPGQTGLRLIWNAFTVPWAAECMVEATVILDDDEPTSRWSIGVKKTPGLGLGTVRFPRCSGLTRQADERLAVPAWMGQQLAEPRKLLRGSTNRGQRLSWSYPGHLSLQCLAYYRDGGCGFHVACDDTAAARKTFSIWGTAAGDVDFEMLHYPVAGVKETDRYALPYRVSLGTFRGDWITAAERYRAWATKQPWAQESRLHRGLVPDWVLETGLWVWNRGRSQGVLPPAAALQERLDLPVSVFWHWWHGCPYDIGFPEYLPPREGTEPFKQAVARAHDEGLRMMVYMNQRAWGMSARSWETEGAERFAVKGADGKVQPEVYNIFTRQALASMCLATPFWRNKYAGLADEAYNDLGVDAIYMDQACSQKPCYDPTHPHPLGGGNSWMEGFRALSEDIRKRCDKNGPIVLAGEGCGEAWLTRLDLMLALQVSKERYSSPNNPWETIPFFHAVYHAYAVIYGNYSSLVMPPYDELWPAEFAPAEPLALLDRKYSRQFYLEQARTFVWGQQPTLANFRPLLFEERPQEIEYLIRLARTRNRAAKYLLYGEFLRPPKLNAPWVASDFSRLSIYAGRKDRLTTFQKRHPLALAGAWRAADGDVALALTNIADEPLALSFTLDGQYLGLPKEPRAYRIDESGRHPIEPPSGDDLRMNLQIPARQAWIIEFSKN